MDLTLWDLLDRLGHLILMELGIALLLTGLLMWLRRRRTTRVQGRTWGDLYRPNPDPVSTTFGPSFRGGPPSGRGETHSYAVLEVETTMAESVRIEQALLVAGYRMRYDARGSLRLPSTGIEVVLVTPEGRGR